MKNICIDGVVYAPVNTDGEKKMIVCVDNRGLMFVGDVNLDEDSEFITIRGARCIIYWGTSGHVAELCAGPTSKTKLGIAHDVIVQKKNIVFAYECDGEKWQS